MKENYIVCSSVGWDGAEDAITMVFTRLTPWMTKAVPCLGATVGAGMEFQFPEDFIENVTEGKPTEFVVKVNA